MKKILFLLIVPGILLASCASRTPVTVTSVPTTTAIATETSIPATVTALGGTQVTTATDSTLTVTPVGETLPTPKEITFTTSGGVEVKMPEFGGEGISSEEATKEALQYVSDNALWVSGDIRQTNWNDVNNATASVKKTFKEYKTLPGYTVNGGTYADVNSLEYVVIYVGGVTGGSLVEYLLPSGDLASVFISGSDPTTLYNQLHSGEVSIPKPSSSGQVVPTATR